jgi:hypothetical protein
MKVTNRVFWRMAIILKANKANIFVSSVLFVFWYHSPNFYTYHIYGATCKVRNFNVIYISYPVAQLCASTLLATKVPLITSSLLGPNTILNTLFSNTHSLRSSLNVRDQVSHPYKTTSKIIVLYKRHFGDRQSAINTHLTLRPKDGKCAHSNVKNCCRMCHLQGPLLLCCSTAYYQQRRGKTTPIGSWTDP